MKPLLLIAIPLTAWATCQLAKALTGAPWFRCLIGRHYYGPWIEADFSDWINSQPAEGRICAYCGRVQLRTKIDQAPQLDIENRSIVFAAVSAKAQ